MRKYLVAIAGVATAGVLMNTAAAQANTAPEPASIAIHAAAQPISGMTGGQPGGGGMTGGQPGGNPSVEVPGTGSANNLLTMILRLLGLIR